VKAGPPRRRIPPPVRPRRAWFVFATTAVLGTIAAALLPSPWAVLCGALAALGATGAFAMFVVITMLEDTGGDGAPARSRRSSELEQRAPDGDRAPPVPHRRRERGDR
jgi:hypothetical protein